MKDIEQVVDDLQAFLDAKLNTELLAIDAEKADGIVLKPVDTKAYFPHSFDSRATNYDPFITLRVGNIESQAIGPATADTLPIAVLLILSDQNADNPFKRLLRYQRAIKTLVLRHFAKISGSDKFKVVSLVVVPLQLLDSSDTFKMIGVELTVTIA